jgi:hypothetical protein
LGRFDGIKDLAEPYPVKVFPDALGLVEEGRESLLPYSSMVFNSLGPRNALTEAAFANADAVHGWIMENMVGSWRTARGTSSPLTVSAPRSTPRSTAGN